MGKEKYIKIMDGTIILKSDNNFKTYERVENIDGYSLVKSRNRITEISLEYQYGKRKSQMIISELKNINKLIFGEKRVDDGYGRAFEVMAISVIHDLTERQTIDNYIINGSNDGKVDAIYWDEKTAYLYQIKMNSYVDTSDFEIAKNNFREYMSSQSITQENAQDLSDFLEKHYDQISEKSVKYRKVSIEDVSPSNFNSKKIIDDYFMKKLINQVKSNTTLKILKTNKRDNENEQNVANYAIHEGNYFLFAEAKDLLESIYSQGINSQSDKLFFENIRGVLGENVFMQDTIKNNPEKFVLYNNGLSILGQCKETSTHFIIDNPTIINGQQTLYNLMLAKEKDLDISKIYLPVFIKSEKNTAERLNIARFNNTQQRVKDLDLLSINSNLRDIQEKLLKEAIDKNFGDDTYYLELISSGKRSYSKDIKSLFCVENIVKLTDFIRSYWVVENKTKLGSWKNKVNDMISEFIIQQNYTFELEQSKKICNLIKQFHNFLKQLDKKSKNAYLVADVVFIYLMSEYDIDQAKSIVDYINKDVFERENPTKLIDLYKSNNILKYIEEAIESLKLKK